IGGARKLRHYTNCCRLPSAHRPADIFDFMPTAVFNGYLAQPVLDLPVDGRARQRDIERHAIVLRREGFEIGADLVADIARRRRPVSTRDAKIDLALLHQMATRVIDDQRMRHAMLAKLPAGEMCPLIARPRLIDPDMHRDASLKSLVNGREGRSPIDSGEPARVAMGEDIETLRPTSLLLLPPVLLQDRKTMIADGA